MAIAVVSSTSGGSTSVSSAATITSSCAFPTGGSVGDFVLAVVRITATTTPGTVATPTGWTLIGSKTGGISTYMYYRIATGSDAASYSFVMTGGSGNKTNLIDMTRFSGVNTTTPIDVGLASVDTNYATGNTQTAVVPSITTVTANAWQIVALSADDACTSSPLATGFTAITNATNYPTRRLAYRVRTSTGATGTSSWAWVGTYNFALQGLTFGLRPSTTVADTTAPTGATVTATAVGPTQINLSFSASDNVGVTSYTIKRGNTVLATNVTGSTYSDTTVTPSATFAYSVIAYDAAGNASAESAQSSATTPATGGSSTYTPTFVGLANGAAWPSAFTGSGGGSATVQNNKGQLTTSTTPYGNNRIEVMSAVAASDGELSGTFTLGSLAEQYLLLGVSGDSTGNVSGYCINVQPNGTIWDLAEAAGAGNAPTAKVTTSFTFVAGNSYSFKIKRAGAVVSAKVWATAGSEPASYVTWTDTSPIAAGVPFVNYVVGSSGAAVTTTFGDFSWTTAGSGGGTVPAIPNQVSGVLLYTTAAGTPVYKYEVVTEVNSGLTTGQKQAFVYVPDGKTAGGSAKLCLAAHGLGDDPSGFMQQASITDPLLRLLMDAGYVVIVPQYDGTLGNSDGQARLLRAYNYLLTKWTTAGTVLFGFSMGGATNGVAMHKGTIPNVKAVQLVSPVINFASEYPANPSPFDAAYGSSSSSTFATATAAWDPRRQAASLYSGQRWRIMSATNDGYVNMRPDAVDFLSYISGVAAQAIDVQVNGGHGSAGQFVNPDQMVSFFEAATAQQNLVATVNLSGAGSLLADGKLGALASVSLSGAGSLLAGGQLGVARTVALSGAGSLLADGKLGALASVSFSGAGTLVVGSAVGGIGRTAALSGSGSLSATQAVAAALVTALSGSGALLAGGTPALVRSTTLSGSGSLTAGTILSITRTAGLSGAGSLVATMSSAFGVNAQLSGDNTLTTQVSGVRTAAGLFSGEGSLVGGVVTLSALAAPQLAGEGSLTAQQVASILSAAGLSGAGSLSASVRAGIARQAALSGSGGLSATQKAALARQAVLSGLGALAVTAGSASVVSAALTGSGQLVGTRTGMSARPMVALTGTGLLVPSLRVALRGTAVFGGSGDLDADQLLNIRRIIQLSGAGVLNASHTGAGPARLVNLTYVWDGHAWVEIHLFAWRDRWVPTRALVKVS